MHWFVFSIGRCLFFVRNFHSSFVDSSLATGRYLPAAGVYKRFLAKNCSPDRERGIGCFIGRCQVCVGVFGVGRCWFIIYSVFMCLVVVNFVLFLSARPFFFRLAFVAICHYFHWLMLSCHYFHWPMLSCVTVFSGRCCHVSLTVFIGRCVAVVVCSPVSSSTFLLVAVHWLLYVDL